MDMLMIRIETMPSNCNASMLNSWTEFLIDLGMKSASEDSKNQACFRDDIQVTTLQLYRTCTQFMNK